jgi:riboflavin kinase/FMN adenylyltransferase
MLLTFSPHPLAVLRAGQQPRLLQTRGQKLECLRQAGLSDVLILEFDLALAALPGEAFIQRLLDHEIAFSAIHVGVNFRFGRDRLGDIGLLRTIGERMGFAVHGVESVDVSGTVVSSTAIRKALDDADVDLAHRMLGRPYSIEGEIVRGDGRGRTLGCPTANLETRNEVLPRAGVYVTETLVRASRFPSVTNVGVRPTFGAGTELLVETHLLDFEGDLYDEPATVRFLARVRDEQRFESVSDLADQLARDRAAAEAFFRDRPLSVP